MKDIRTRVISAIKYVCPRDYRWDSGHTPKQHFNLWVVLSGTGTLKSGGRTWRLQAGDCFVLRMWERQRAFHGEMPLIVTSIHFRDTDAEGRFIPYHEIPDRNTRYPLHRQVDDLPFFERLTDRVVGSMAEEEEEATASWMRTVFLELNRLDKAPSLAGIAQEQYQRLMSLRSEIRSRPELLYRATDLAARMSCSTTHLTRLFKQFFGQTPQAFILQCRIDYAKSLLRNSSYTLTQLAGMLNYSSPFHFSRQFKEKVGVSPSAFRKSELT